MRKSILLFILTAVFLVAGISGFHSHASEYAIKSSGNIEPLFFVDDIKYLKNELDLLYAETE